jgi:hypothetical protein
MAVTLSDEQFDELVEQVTEKVKDEFKEESERLSRELADERKKRSELEERVDDLEEQLDSQGGHDVDEYEDVPEHELAYIERLHHLGRDGVDNMPRKRDVHAKILFENLPDWGFEAQNGDVIVKTAGKLRQKMRRALGEQNFEYTQLYRACEALAERAGPKIDYLEENPKVGRHIRIPSAMRKRLALDLSVVSKPQAESKDGMLKTIAMT